MAPSLLGYIGLSSTSTPEIPAKKPPVRALPAPWYTSREFYEFERRAIFSRRWLLMTHQSRLREAGDFLRFEEMAGFDVVIVRDRSGNINAFHNVCRHRAYPVVEKDKGNAKIFSCRYHGWSYGLDGKLAKAPDYHLLEFEKSLNGLLKIHVHVDVNGFIWINLDGNKTPEVPWSEHFDGVDKQARFEAFNFDDYDLDHTYELTGSYNWKILADNFNECYHCPGTHPDISSFMTVDSHDCEVKDGHIQHDQAPSDSHREKGLNVNSTYYFPNVSMSVSPHFLMIQKFLPSGPSQCSMHYEVYRNRHSSDEDFNLISSIYARVMSEDKVLCERAQKNLNAGVIVGGELHPRWEKGPLFFQQMVREVVTDHFKREKAAGHEIWPARQRLPENEVVSQEDLEICNAIACMSGSKEGLVW